MNQLLPRSRWAIVGCALALVALPTLGWSQVRVMPVPIRGFARPAMMRPGVMPGVAPSDDPDNKFSDGPGLKTDPEAQQLLSRAEQFVQDERFDLAAVLWQKVLDDSGDSLVSVDGRLYISLRRQVEQRLAKLPKLALQTYRVTADGEAQAVLSAAGAEKEEDALAEVVRRFFLSSLGDDAAYKLGCLALDRYDFIGASRLFAKVLEEHPDPSMPRSELLIRLAVAAGRVGDRDGAKKFLADLEATEGPRPSRKLVSLVADDIAQGTSNSQLASTRLLMPAIPAEATAKTLTELWSHEYPMLFQEQALNAVAYSAYGGHGRKLEKTQISREQLIERWKQHGWTPAGKLLIANGQVYFKTNNELTSWSTSGDDDQPIWRSAWLNDFDVDDYSQQLAIMAMNMGVQPGGGQEQRPRTPAEILLFGDRIQQDMSLAGDMIYSIEGRRMPRHGPADAAARQPKPFNWNATPRRTRVNWLAAYDARNGKAKWHRTADDEAKEGTEGSMGFMAAPVACGNVLLAPVTDGGAMWLFGLSPTDGRTLWKTYLCDEPVGGCEAWSPVEVAVEGRDAYVLCGAGVVFAVDGTSGSIRWVARYDRDEKPLGSRAVRNPYGAAGRLKDFDGWSQDTLIPFGRQLVVMASDSNLLFALDCRTGEFLWDSPRKKLTGEEVTYCIGLKGRGLFVAGKSQVRRIDVVSGKIIWETDIDTSLGHGVLTDDALYVPVNDSVLKLDLEKGTELGQVGVRITSNDPVGNLYSDGEKLWVLSANRFYSLTHLEYRMNVLEKRIEEGDSAALLDRLRLLAKSEQWDDAMTDLGRAYRLISQHKDRDAAATDVLEVLDELKLALHRPTLVLTTLTELFAEETPHFKTETRAKLDMALSAALAAIPRQKASNVVGSILAAAPLFRQDSLVNNAARLVKAVAEEDDKELLQSAVTAGKEPASIIAAEAWAIVDPETARPALKPWLGSGDAQVKLLASRALLQTGDHAALEALIAMLDNSDLQVRIRSYQSLLAATGKNDLSFTAYASAEERSKQISAWKDWYAADGKTAKLTLPLPETGTQLGRTLVCSHSQNKVVELDSTGKEVGRRTIAQAWSALGLPNGNRLVAVTSQGRLVEYDDQWKETWVVDGLPAGIWSVDRAMDGNTLVAAADAAQVIEIKPNKEKKVFWRGDGNGRPVFVKRLENGNTLICLQNQNKVIEVDGTGKHVWEASNLVNPFSAQRLENGNTLVAAMGINNNGSIVEVDSAGRQTKVMKQGLRQLYKAELLANGNLLYADSQGLHEIDGEGKNVWSRREVGITGFSRF
jgi:outer membrane protein assembly factor BamB